MRRSPSLSGTLTSYPRPEGGFLGATGPCAGRRPLVEQGDAKAQYILGLMYLNGQGVPRDYATALSWLRKAAEQGYADAQNFLGQMYAGGYFVPQDYVIAHMWFDLAVASGRQDAAKIRDTIAARMTPAQIAEAQKLAREWKPKPSP
jgi:uncharacterized protein